MSGNKLKCFFAFSNDIENNKIYTDMLIATLASARANTTLDLHCLYDGEKNDKLYAILRKYDVTVHIKTIPFLPQILKIYTPEFMQHHFKTQISEKSLRARFLRMLLPDVTDDEYVLYVDTDVMFLQDIKLSDFGKLPEYIGVCPEFEKTQDYTYFNAGVMLINVPKMRDKYKEFLEMINNGQTATIECCDQGYLNDLYRGVFDKLPLEYNWKPYYGYNPNAKIIHFHGIKPNAWYDDVFGYIRDSIINNDCISAYYKYYDKFCDYAGIDKQECLNKLTVTLTANIPCGFVKARKYKHDLKKLRIALWVISSVLCVSIILHVILFI